jgi:S-adenosylmethionine:tRNA ribosyltransferase-isomerase
MLLNDLDYSFSESLIAIEKVAPSRVMCVTNGDPSEITIAQLLDQIPTGDVLVINNTQVLKRRVFSEGGLEILFLKQISALDWTVLFPASRVGDREHVQLPDGVSMQLLTRGLPQSVRLSQAIDESYFEKVGELPLPPYIQKARGERHTREQDTLSYQTEWARRPGSFAAPTASLHFAKQDLEQLKARGVQVLELTLHVGLGTFLPVKNFETHEMHAEWVELPDATWQAIRKAQSQGHHIWALGTTVTRALESAAQHQLQLLGGAWQGWSELFIRPPYTFRVVDRLLTNFHQPKSTLLALVATFAGLETVHSSYQWAIERQFRLFSYGDLSVWMTRR